MVECKMRLRVKNALLHNLGFVIPPYFYTPWRRATSDDVDAERKRWRASSLDDWWSSSTKYGGAVWCRHVHYQNSQLKLDALRHLQPVQMCQQGVMQSYLDAENTGRAAEFHTDGIRLVRCDGMPASAPLRYHSLTAAERGTKPVTEERSAEMSNKYSAIDAESQNRQLQSLRQTTSSTHQ